MRSPDLAQRGDRLESQEAVRVVERRDERRHRRRGRQQRQSGRHVPAHPHVLVGIAHEVRQRRHDLVAVANQHLAGVGFQPAVAQQRDQRRDEEEVPAAQVAGALDGRLRHLDVRVLHERNQQHAERRILDFAEYAGDLQAQVRRPIAPIVGKTPQGVFRDLHVALVGARSQGSGGGDDQCGIGAAEVRPHDVCRRFGANGRERGDRGDAHLAVGVGERALHAGRPAVGAFGARVLGDSQGAGAHLGRLVPEQERRHQIPLVQRLEQIDGVEHALRLWTGQLGHERLDRREVAGFGADVGGPDVLLFDAAAEGLEVLAPGRERESRPDGHHRDAGVAQLLPAQAKSPILHEHEQHQRADALGHAIDRHVDEWLGLVLDVDRQRQEEDFARRLVNGIAN